MKIALLPKAGFLIPRKKMRFTLWLAALTRGMGLLTSPDRAGFCKQLELDPELNTDKV